MIIKAVLFCSGISAIAVAVWSGLINLTIGRPINACFTFIGMGTLGIMAIRYATKNWKGIIHIYEKEDKK